MMTTFTTEDRLNAELLKNVFREVSKKNKVSKKDLLKASPSNTPYMTSTGIQIGKYYQKPKYIEEDNDMLKLQSFLVYDPAILKKQYWIKFAYKVSVVIGILVIMLANK
jgi:hypothetical protein